MITRISQLHRYSQLLRFGLFLCVALAGSAAGNAETPSVTSYEAHSPTISVASDLVLLPVNVTDTHGNVVSGLHKEDFRVYQENQLQTLTVFQHEDSPVGVGLVVDHSASMKSKLLNVAAAISAFAKSGNQQDEMFVVDFGNKASLAPLGGKPFTNHASEVETAIEPFSASGRTALYDAVAEGITHLGLSQWQRRALIVISDGGDNASYHNRSEILKLAHESQVIIYSIILADGHSKDENPKALERLCKETGGVAFLPQTLQALMDSSLLIARDLREQYTLGFVPDSKQIGPSFRKIEVQVLAPRAGKLNIRTRRGYFTRNPQSHNVVLE